MSAGAVVLIVLAFSYLVLALFGKYKLIRRRFEEERVDADAALSKEG